MPTIQKDLEEYLLEVTGLPARVLPHAGAEGLPHYLAQRYEPRVLALGTRRFMAVFLRKDVEITPAAFEKHLRQLPADDTEGYCLVAQTLTSHVRRRLIERRIPFAVPWTQLYLPQLGMDARPRGVREQQPPVHHSGHLSPAAQLVVLMAVNRRLPTPASALQIARQTGYTPMTMTRVLNELEARQLGQQTRVGKERLLAFPEETGELWKNARPLLRTPVQERVRVMADAVPIANRLLAGESALAEMTMLGMPTTPEFALGRDAWKLMTLQNIERIPIPEPGTCMVQVWRYEPALLAEQQRVDPYSLYLSLAEERDERVQAALEDMLARLK